MGNADLERKAEVAELLLHAARRLAESIEPERIYERFHELVGDVIQHDGVIVSSYDDRDDLIRCEYAWTDGAAIDPASLPPVPLNREGGGMQSRVILTGEPELFNDVPQRVTQVAGVYYNVDAEGNVAKIPESGPAKTTAAMMVPVEDDGRVVGVVQLMTDSGTYSEDDLELFDGLVAQMGAAVRNARLQQERRRLEAAEAAALAVAREREQAAHVADPIGDEGGMARPVTLPIEVGGRDLWLSFVAVRTTYGVICAFRDVTRETRLEEEKTDFVATISHELRTPMAAVYGAAETPLRR